MASVSVRDDSPERAQFLHDVLAGLRQPQKSIPCKYLYDERGSELFDRICELDEYYPTRTELGIMQNSAGEMAGSLGERCALIEYGSGSSLKTMTLLEHLDGPAGYVPVDISGDHLQRAAEKLSERFPGLTIEPVCADFTQSFELPAFCREAARRVVYFPGSTIGNFAPDKAGELLAGIRTLLGETGGLLIGVDLPKSRTVLEAAYNDREGVTAAFNLNLLAHINRELGADFDAARFEHRAVVNEDESRVEMHLVSQAEQVVHLDGQEIAFRAGETIHTENSHKYGLERFRGIAERAGFEVDRVWTDADRYFSVQSLTPQTVSEQ